MATKPYWLSFGDTAITGLAPTFTQFRTTAGSTLPPPGITAPGAFGMYMFEYEALTQVAFVCDGATTGLSQRYINGVLDPFDLFGYTLNTMGASMNVMGNSLSVMGGSLSVMGGSLNAMGVTVISLANLIDAGFSQGVLNYSLIVQNYSLAVQNYSLAIQGASLLGDTASSFGTNLADPTTVFGFLKRAQEDLEGNEVYTKASGDLDIYSRGSSYLLAEKLISDSTTETTKT